MLASLTRKKVAKALFVASSATATFCLFALVPALVGGGFAAGIAILKLAPLLFVALPIMPASLFSGFAKPKAGPPRLIHMTLFACGASVHAIGITLLSLPLINGNVRISEWRETALIAAFILAAAAVWIALYPPRPALVAQETHSIAEPGYSGRRLLDVGEPPKAKDDAPTGDPAGISGPD